MQKFRKKPVVIEAIKYNGTIGTANYILSWIGDDGAKAKRAHNTKPEAGIVINTLEGDMTAVPGDWIIKGIKGEFYPCKPEIFTATYDPVIEEDEFTCIGCGNVIQDGELVFHEYGEGGLIHAECLGSDRESYCNDDGEPLGSDNPLPTPFPFVRAEYFPTAGKLVESEKTAAARDVLAERRRQIETEGWSPLHDDKQTDSEMAHAAACYALNDAAVWPWSISWWKPTDRRRNLVKAGALILAEIERLDRLSAPVSEGAE